MLGVDTYRSWGHWPAAPDVEKGRSSQATISDDVFKSQCRQRASRAGIRWGWVRGKGTLDLSVVVGKLVCVTLEIELNRGPELLYYFRLGIVR